MSVSQVSGIQFRLDRRSGVPVYRQLVDQVEQALDLGVLRRGDQLPPLSQVVGQLAINPNTVHRAYQELELKGVTEARQGIGTFVVKSTSSPVPPARRQALERSLGRWVRSAMSVGLDERSIRTLLAKVCHSFRDDAR